MNKHTAQLLEKHFDAAFAAPDGIKKLRELILTLAMRGKLVPQDPNDRPASELLKEIQAEKQQLVQDSTIKRQAPLPPVTDQEKPFGLPQGWEWVRLGEIGVWKSGSTPSRSNSQFYGGNIPWVKSGEVKQGRIKATEETITQAALDNCSLHINKKGSVLVAMYGANIGEVGILEVEAATNQAVCACKTYARFDENYLLYLITSLKPYFLSQGAGAAQPNISREKIIATVFPLPPFTEQHRIVAKIDELMARCDELEKLRTAQNAKRLTVHTVAIKQLLNITEPSEHQRAQAFLTRHFGELYTVKENVAELRKAILQLAVMGRLLPDIEPPRLLPLESMLAESSINGVSKGPTDDTSAIEVLRISAGTSRGDFYVDEDDFKHVILSPNEIEKFKLQPNDLLACRFNGNLHYVGRFSLYRGCSGRTQVNPDKLIRFRINTEKHCPRYICYAMNADSTRSVIEAMCATTAGNIGLSAGRLKTVQIPAPSVEQQHRIVKKIEELMSLCDTLEMKIDATTKKQTELLNALLNAKPKDSGHVIDLATYRSAIGCYAVNKLAKEPYFGRTAAAKVLYLAQAHIGLKLDFHPEREAAGPLDKWIYDFEKQGERNGWFAINQKSTKAGYIRYEYKPSTAMNEPAKQAENLMTQDEREKFDQLTNLLRDKNTEEVEIIATLFAVWNDFLIDGIKPTDEQIITDMRENWHEKKKRFTPAELGKWLNWMRKEKLIPRGLPPRTVHQPKLTFN